MMGGSQEHTQPHSDKRACSTKISAQGERQQTVHDAIHARYKNLPTAISAMPGAAKITPYPAMRYANARLAALMAGFPAL
jgi:hypothetical protein